MDARRLISSTGSPEVTGAREVEKVGKQTRSDPIEQLFLARVNWTLGSQFALERKYLLAIHLIPKWRQINYSFVFMLISPLPLVNMYKEQKSFEVKMRRRGLINMQTKE